MTQVVVLDGARTPIGAFGGSLREVNAPTLLEHAFRAALDKTRIDPTEIDETIVGQVFQGSDAPGIARFCSLRVGIPQNVPGMTLNRQCASGLEAAVYAAKDIMLGEAKLVLTGGVESMSTVPYHVRGLRWGVKMGPQPERVNVNGGAIALGHPVGMSGNRLLLTMAYELKRRKAEFGVIALCAGGGQGIAMVVANSAA